MYDGKLAAYCTRIEPLPDGVAYNRPFAVREPCHNFMEEREALTVPGLYT